MSIEEHKVSLLRFLFLARKISQSYRTQSSLQSNREKKKHEKILVLINAAPSSYIAKDKAHRPSLLWRPWEKKTAADLIIIILAWLTVCIQKDLMSIEHWIFPITNVKFVIINLNWLSYWIRMEGEKTLQYKP